MCVNRGKMRCRPTELGIFDPLLREINTDTVEESNDLATNQIRVIPEVVASKEELGLPLEPSKRAAIRITEDRDGLECVSCALVSCAEALDQFASRWDISVRRLEMLLVPIPRNLVGRCQMNQKISRSYASLEVQVEFG